MTINLIYFGNACHFSNYTPSVAIAMADEKDSIWHCPERQAAIKALGDKRNVWFKFVFKGEKYREFWPADGADYDDFFGPIKVSNKRTVWRFNKNKQCEEQVEEEYSDDDM
jgi:hypothetical protein